MARGRRNEEEAPELVADEGLDEEKTPSEPEKTAHLGLYTLKAPEGTCDVCLEGQRYEIAKDGTVRVPYRHLAQLVRHHGFTEP